MRRLSLRSRDRSTEIVRIDLLDRRRCARRFAEHRRLQPPANVVRELVSTPAADAQKLGAMHLETRAVERDVRSSDHAAGARDLHLIELPGIRIVAVRATECE